MSDRPPTPPCVPFGTRRFNQQCKDIVAFLNSDGGDVIIGVDDCGNVVGIDHIDETSKKISDLITSQIEPNPQDIISSEMIYDEGSTLSVRF